MNYSRRNSPRSTRARSRLGGSCQPVLQVDHVGASRHRADALDEVAVARTASSGLLEIAVRDGVGKGLCRDSASKDASASTSVAPSKCGTGCGRA
jgi:hypothetical protein